MLHDSANDDGCVALKRAAEDREGWRHVQKKDVKTCSIQQMIEDYRTFWRSLFQLTED